MLPPWPGWDGLHPLVIHFPVALLLVAPAFLILAAVSRRHATGFRLSALILLALGTAAAFVAVETGEAAAELADRTEAITAVIARHSELAERARDMFAAITVCYALLLVLPRFVKRLASPGAQTGRDTGSARRGARGRTADSRRGTPGWVAGPQVRSSRDAAERIIGHAALEPGG